MPVRSDTRTPRLLLLLMMILLVLRLSWLVVLALTLIMGPLILYSSTGMASAG